MLEACSFIRMRPQRWCFQNTYFEEHLRTTAFGNAQSRLLNQLSNIM